MSGFLVLGTAKVIGIERFVENLLESMNDHDQVVLSSYGMKVLHPIMGDGNSPVLNSAEHSYLLHLEQLTALHSNAYAFYFPVGSGILRLRFKAFAEFLEKELNWQYDGEAAAQYKNHRLEFIFEAYNKLNACRERHKLSDEQYTALCKIITTLLLNNFLGNVRQPIMPTDTWKERDGYEFLYEYYWIIRQVGATKTLYTNLLNDFQIETPNTQPFNHALCAELEGFSTAEKLLYLSETPIHFQHVNVSIFHETEVE